MIIGALTMLIFVILDNLFFVVLPALPDSIMTIGATVIDYVVQGIRIIEAFTGSAALGVVALLLQLVLLIHSMYALWSIIKFILMHVPILNIGK